MSEDTTQPDTLECIINSWRDYADSPEGIDPNDGIETILATAYSHGARSLILVEMVSGLASLCDHESRDEIAKSFALAEIDCDRSVTEFVNKLRASIQRSIDAN